MNRQQRRAEQRRLEKEQAQAILHDDMRQFMPEEYFRKKAASMDKLQRNGITVEDLKANYEKGRNDGFHEAAEPIWQGCFAAVCLALNDLYGFGKKRCSDVLNAVDQHMAYTLTTEEAIQEVFQRIGLELDFSEPFDRVREVEQ